MRQRWLELGVLVAGLCAAAPAGAQSAFEEEARDRLIGEAKAAHGAGEHRKALDFAERAAAIRMTPSLRYLLGHEQQELGLFAEAFGNAQRCARELELDPQNPDRETFAGLCAAMRDQLQAQIAYLTLALPDAPEGTEVKVNGTVLNRALLGVPFVVTPGKAVIEARAPGKLPYRGEVTTTAGARLEVKIPLAAAPTPAPAAPAPEEPCPPGTTRAQGVCIVAPLPAAAAPAGLASDVGVADDESGASYRRWGLGLTAAGAALMVGAGATYFLGHRKFLSAREQCNDAHPCSFEVAEDHKSGVRTYDRIALGGAIGSGVLLTAGSVLYVLAARKDDVERLDRLRVAVGLVGAGIAVVAAIYGIATAGKSDKGTSTSTSGLSVAPGGIMIASPLGRF